MSRKVRVLVVDDSALVRKSVARLVEEDLGLEVVGFAGDGAQALAAVENVRPDVVTLDVSMPVMDGLTCLGELVRRHRQRVVILSTLASESSFTTYKALALGAVDFVLKPGSDSYFQTLEETGRQLRQKIWAAAAVPASRIGRPSPSPAPRAEPQPEPRASDAPAPLTSVIGVGGSTGGAAALETLLRGLPAGIPAAVLAVQHMPAGFSSSFARYLDTVSAVPVSEGREGEPVRPRRAYVAPGGVHLRLQSGGDGPVLRLDGATPSLGGYRPSINALFCSVAAAEKGRAIGVLLSGMGEDGVVGLAAIRKVGGATFVQDEETSVVYGMAERAVAAGVVDHVVPLGKLPSMLGRAATGSLREVLP